MKLPVNNLNNSTTFAVFLSALIMNTEDKLNQDAGVARRTHVETAVDLFPHYYALAYSL